MAILIEGMEMPTEDEEIIIRIDSNGTVMTEYALPISGTKAVSVPPHGDLIDREELHYIIGQLSLNWEYGQGISDCWDAFLDAPTVIQASTEG